MKNKRMPDDVFKALQEYEKEYGIVWMRPTQNDPITTLLHFTRRLLRAQRSFNPLKQESLMEYHRAVKKAKKALSVLKEEKRPKAKPKREMEDVKEA